MSDDIVTRLRDNCACSGTEQFGYTCTSCDAADEIERLRQEVNKWRFHADDLYRALQVQRGFTFHTATAQGAEERYEKAVRVDEVTY